MSAPRVRYAEAPILVHVNPECDSCGIATDMSDDGWECPTCCTTWDWNDYDQRGTQYADWSGESVDHMPVTDEDDGFKVAGLPYENERRDTLYARWGIK